MPENPYESPKLTPRDSSNVPLKYGWALFAAAVSAFVHYNGAKLTWLMFYGFESTVIEEELYLAGSHRIRLVMSTSGAILGGFLGFIFRKHFAGPLFLQCCVGFITALIFASFGYYWTLCLTAGIATQFLVLPLFWLMKPVRN